MKSFSKLNWVRIKLLLSIISSIPLCENSDAQTWSMSPKSEKLMSGCVVHIESPYNEYNKKEPDTLSGTGFLISDKGKIYLVTVKHLITANLTGKEQRFSNKVLLLSTSWKKDDKRILVEVLPNTEERKSPILLSSDDADLAIISFQQPNFQNILFSLLTAGHKPIPIDSIDTSVTHQNGDSYYIPTYFSGLDKTGKTNWREGTTTGKLKTVNLKTSTFLVDQNIAAVNLGAPLFINDKLIGILSNAEVNMTNTDILRDPFHRTNPGKAIKASQLIPLLKQLQKRENMPGF